MKTSNKYFIKEKALLDGNALSLPKGCEVKKIKENDAIALLKTLKLEKKKLIYSKSIMDKKDRHAYPILDVPFAIPSNWIWCYLSDISIIQEGPGIRKYQYANEGVQFLTVTNILEGSVDLNKSKKYISLDEYNNKYVHFTLSKGDVVTACSGGSWGKSAIYNLNDRVILNTSTLRLRFYNDLGNNRYLYFLTKASYFKKNLSSHSTGQQPNYGYSHYSKIPIPLPPLPEQKRIVALLDQAFTAIAKAKANTEQNLKNAREIFQSALQTEFANGKLKIENGEWEEKKLGDSSLVEIIDGDRGKNYPTKKDFLEEGFCLFMNTKNVRPNGFRFDTVMFINEAKDKSMGKGKLKRKDVVMTTRGTIGNLGIYSDGVGYNNIRINSGMLIFRPNQKRITSKYLFELFRSKTFKEQIKKNTSGVAQPQLPIKTLVNFRLPVPKSLKEQKHIVKKLDALSTETKKLETIYQQKINDLDELKKSILQKTFRGEL